MRETETPTVDAARAALDAQPFSALLGTRLTSIGTDGATLELDVREIHTQQDGIVHGGVVAYLIDNAMAFAAATVLGIDLVTGGLTVDFLRPAGNGRLAARATVVRAGADAAVLTCEVRAVDPAGDGRLCAIGQGRVTRRRR